MSLSLSPNYQSIPQFFTSVGVLFIALFFISQIFLLTYLNKEFLIAVNEAENLKVTWNEGFPENSPQQLIHRERVRDIEKFERKLNIFSFSFLSVGVLLVIVGMCFWLPLQKKQNELLDLTIKKTKLEIQKK